MGSIFVEWLFDLYTASALNPDINEYVRAEAIKFRRKNAVRLKAKEKRTLERLEKHKAPAALLLECLNETDFKL